MIDEKVLIEILEELKKVETDREDCVDENGYYNDVEEAFDDGEGNGRYQAYCRVEKIVNQLAEESKNEMVNQLAMMYAVNFAKFGIDVTAKLETATQNSMALNQAYMRGRQDERDRFARWQEEHNNGWIACSERLPSKEEYQKSNGQFIVSDGNRTYATYFDIYDTLKFGEPTIDHFRVDKRVIAWQPLPAPYKPKGE